MEQNTKIYVAISSIIFLLIAGTIFYTSVEKWRPLDSFYFTSITLTTIGYGDFAPKTDMGKMGTVFIAFTGVAIVLYALTMIGTAYFERREKLMLEREGSLMDKRLREFAKGTVETMKGTAATMKTTATNIGSELKNTAGALHSKIGEKLKERPEFGTRYEDLENGHKDKIE